MKKSPTIKAENIAAELKSASSKEKAKLLSGFFKTGEGQYGEGDMFIGVTIPVQRVIAKRHAEHFRKGFLSLNEIGRLLDGEIHEHRMTALLILGYLLQDKQSDAAFRKTAFDFYLKRVKRVNNWDLVDSSAREVVGQHLFRDRRSKMLPLLLKYAMSEELWIRRIAIVATHYSIMRGSARETCAVADALLDDKHDLIHKAAGWMLREMGKKDQGALRAYLDLHAHHMPRTMLRYALEKLPESDRKRYMSMKKASR